MRRCFCCLSSPGFFTKGPVVPTYYPDLKREVEQWSSSPRETDTTPQTKSDDRAIVIFKQTRERTRAYVNQAATLVQDSVITGIPLTKDEYEIVTTVADLLETEAQKLDARSEAFRNNELKWQTEAANRFEKQRDENLKDQTNLVKKIDKLVEAQNAVGFWSLLRSGCVLLASTVAVCALLLLWKMTYYSFVMDNITRKKKEADDREKNLVQLQQDLKSELEELKHKRWRESGLVGFIHQLLGLI